MFLKFLLNFLVAPLKNLVAELQANRDANIAAIEATVGTGSQTAEAAVAGFLTSTAKKEPILAFVVPLAEPELLATVAALVAKGDSSIPALYDAGVAFLTHEESVL
jgi:alcohol dehydrogenase class IV